MPITYIPVRPRGGGLVHAVTLLTSPTMTVCGRRFRGWVVAPVGDGVNPAFLTCPDCKAKIHLPVRTNARAQASR